jgi:hypothetical protein
MITGPQLHQGWLVVPYDGDDLSLVEIGVGDQWVPAFLDWVDDQRVAKIRPSRLEAATGTVYVSLRVDGAIQTQTLASL